MPTLRSRYEDSYSTLCGPKLLLAIRELPCCLFGKGVRVVK